VPSRIASTVSCGTPASSAQFNHPPHSYGASSAREPMSENERAHADRTIDSSAAARMEVMARCAKRVARSGLLFMVTMNGPLIGRRRIA